MNFTQRLLRIQRANQSLLCVGLDTDIDKIPQFLRAYDDPIFEFNRRIVNATKDLVCAYKLNFAFYEAHGERGMISLRKTLARIPKDIVTIGDAKRGDIGNTAVMYAKVLFDQFGFSACTVNPYMGTDSVEPFMTDRRRGVFILAVTSNPGARDFQYLNVARRPLYEHVIEKAQVWNTRGNCGLVVGATRPEELRRVRALAPAMPLLIPGVGAQGGDLKLVVRYGCDPRGEMAIINASRSIIYASPGRDFARTARAAALAMNDEIDRHRGEFF